MTNFIILSFVVLGAIVIAGFLSLKAGAYIIRGTWRMVKGEKVESSNDQI